VQNDSRLQARDCLATWEEKIVFTCSLTREGEGEDFDARGISFSLKEVLLLLHSLIRTHAHTHAITRHTHARTQSHDVVWSRLSDDDGRV
jgi:hypothetical protein